VIVRSVFTQVERGIKLLARQLRVRLLSFQAPFLPDFGMRVTENVPFILVGKNALDSLVGIVVSVHRPKLRLRVLGIVTSISVWALPLL
jgi:hypothetical protein